MAAHHGIDTFTLVDTEGTDWKSYASVPVLLERTFIENVSFSVEGVAAGGRRVAQVGAPTKAEPRNGWWYAPEGGEVHSVNLCVNAGVGVVVVSYGPSGGF